MNTQKLWYLIFVYFEYCTISRIRCAMVVESIMKSYTQQCLSVFSHFRPLSIEIYDPLSTVYGSFSVWWVVSLRDTPSRMRWRTWEHQSLIQTQFATQHREATQLNALEKQSWWSYTTLLPHVARPPLLALTKRGSTTLRQNKCPLLTTRLPAGWISTLSTPKAMFHALFWMMELFSMRMLPFFSTLLTWYTVQHTLHSSFS